MSAAPLQSVRSVIRRTYLLLGLTLLAVAVAYFAAPRGFVERDRSENRFTRRRHQVGRALKDLTLLALVAHLDAVRGHPVSAGSPADLVGELALNGSAAMQARQTEIADLAAAELSPGTAPLTERLGRQLEAFQARPASAAALDRLLLIAGQLEQLLDRAVELREEERAARRLLNERVVTGLLLAVLAGIVWAGTHVLRSSRGILHVLAETVSERDEQALALQRERDFAARLTDTAPAIILLLDPRGVIQHVNPHFESLTGWRLSDIKGKEWFDTLLPARDRDRIRELFQKAIRGAPTRGIINPIVTRTGVEVEIEWNDQAVRDADGRVTSLLAVGIDVTERRRAEEGLREFKATLDQTRDCVFIFTPDSLRFTYANAGATAQVGYTPAELTRMTPLDIKPEFDEPRFRALIAPLVKGERPSLTFETLHRHRDGTTIPVEIVLQYVAPADQPARFVAVVRDVSERKKLDQRLRLALEASGQATFEGDLETMTGRVSPEYAQMLGFTPDELPGLANAAFEERVHPADRERVSAALRAHLAGETAKYQAEFRLRTKSGGWKWILANGKVVERAADGRPLRLTGTHTDIDERKDAELRISSSLREKETLLREIHHRVKNNLQVISSLLYFQGKKLRAPEEVAAFAELRQRIFAMTLVHERLYQSPDVARVDVGDYVRALVAELGRSFEPREGIRIDVATDDVRLPVELALPSGMIVCELVTNVLKYAFPGAREGRATVSVRTAGGRVLLAVDDDGVGFPEGFDTRAGSSFGWELVRTLVSQLAGTVEATTDRGAHVQVSFPAPAPVEGRDS